MIMNKIRTTVMSCVLLGAAVSSVACGAADMGGEFDDGAGAEEVGVSEEAVGEAACGTMACTSGNSCADFDIPTSCAAGPVFKLSSLPYGTAFCPTGDAFSRWDAGRALP
jgi:hypothetical protein